MDRFLTSQEAAEKLGISLPTLYAYVSRGVIRSEVVPGQRQKRYRLEDIEEFHERGRQNRSHKELLEGVLNFGEPILNSSISRAVDNCLYYRDYDSEKLAGRSTLEDVAALLWECDLNCFGEAPPSLPEGIEAWLEHQLYQPLTVAQMVLPLAAEHDHRAFDVSTVGCQRTGVRVLRLVAGLLTRSSPRSEATHLIVANALGQSSHADLVRAVLVLAADHELSASAFAVRVVASSRSSPYHAVVSGLATLQGARHGGEIIRAAEFLQKLFSASDAERKVAECLQRGDDMPGFGHPLYQAGDPRARSLLSIMKREKLLDSHVITALQSVCSLTEKRLNFDGALALVTILRNMKPEAGLTMLAIGRTVGWIAHAMEQYQEPKLIRPRARYAGR